MRVNWGGKQNRVRDTEIKKAVEYLSPHSPKLQVGSIQKMLFQEDDEGPSYLTPINHEFH
jgi:hypothetical protein